MKRYKYAKLFSIQTVHAAPSIDQARKSLKCVDGIFAHLARVHNELKKYHSEYAEMAKKTNLHLDQCEKTVDPAPKKR